METIHYILDNWDYLLTLTLQHLWLVALAVGLAIIIGVPGHADTRRGHSVPAPR